MIYVVIVAGVLIPIIAAELAFRFGPWRGSDHFGSSSMGE